MTESEYDLWMEHHAVLFMMSSDQDAALFAAWRRLVLPYSLAEFIDGSNYLATEKAGAFRTTHLDHIRQRINVRKMELVRLRLEQEQKAMERYECKVCNGVGVVSVPHVEHVRNMEWLPPYVSFSILCFCSLGRSKFNALTDSIHDTKAKGERSPGYPLAWEKYEALVPNWEELLKWREQMRKDERAAGNIAMHADKVAPLKLVKRIVSKIGVE